MTYPEPNDDDVDLLRPLTTLERIGAFLLAASVCVNVLFAWMMATGQACQ